MNMHTFKDAVASRRQTVADQFLEDDDEEEVVRVDAKSNVEGEEDMDYAGGGKVCPCLTWERIADSH